MAWAKLGTNTLVSGNNVVSITGLTKKKFNMFISHITGSSSSVDFKGRVGDGSYDYTTSYATRENQDGTENVRLSATYFASGLAGYGVSNGNSLHITYGINIATEEKLFIDFGCLQNTAGAGNAPSRYKQAYKWINTSVQYDQYEYINASSVTYSTDSNISVIGTD